MNPRRAPTSWPPLRGRPPHNPPTFTIRSLRQNRVDQREDPHVFGNVSKVGDVGFGGPTSVDAKLVERGANDWLGSDLARTLCRATMATRGEAEPWDYSARRRTLRLSD